MGVISRVGSAVVEQKKEEVVQLLSSSELELSRAGAMTSSSEVKQWVSSAESVRLSSGKRKKR